MQGPAIDAAKELGYSVYVVDADTNAVCIPKADFFKKIDLKAKEEIAEYARTIPELKAVFTAGTDFSASVSYVCSELGLKAHTVEASLNASNKIRMRGCFSDKGVPSPKFRRFSQNDFSSSLEEIIPGDFPFVVKPCDNMGGRGCRMVRKNEELVPALKDAVASSRSGTAIVEEYMEGREFSIDALVYDGTFTVTGFAERHIKYPPYFIEVGHTMPVVLEKKIHDELISVFALGAKALGLSCGAAKADIKYTDKGPMIGEIAGRLSGGYMSGWTYPYASGMNLTKEALCIALGKEPVALNAGRKPVDFVTTELCRNAEKPYELYEVPCRAFSAERAWISIPGTVEDVILPDCSSSKIVKDFLPRATVSKNGKVDFPRNNVQKCGNVITLSENREDAVSEAHKAVSEVFIKLKPNDRRTDDFLKGVENPDEESFPPSAFPVENSVLDSVSGIIPENGLFSENIPESLTGPQYGEMTDWNYLTISETCRKLDVLVPEHKSVPARDFFKALCRGGIQGAWYYLNSVKI